MEKVFFTTAIPVGANAGKLLSSEIIFIYVAVIGQKPVMTSYICFDIRHST